MKFSITRTFELNDQDLNLLEELQHANYLFNSDGIFSTLINQGLASEDSDGQARITKTGISILEQLHNKTYEKTNEN